MITENPNKIPNFECVNCEYITCNKKDFNKHLMTRKHIIRTKLPLNDNKNNFEKHSDILLEITDDNAFKKYICNGCKKSYSHHSGLSRHNKLCKIKNINNTDVINILEQPNMVIELIKQNQEFKDLLSDQNKIIMKLAENQGNNSSNITNNIMNNSNNKTFNLQFFLNETCKDAMNIKDFVDTLQISLEDLEKVGSEGFVEGISSIFINALKKLDIHKRPIHCSDLKRETVYLKDEDIWKKDNDKKEHLKKIVELIAYKNQSKIFEWKAAHPDYKDSDSKTNDWYLQIVIQCSGGKNDAEDERLYDKIVKNITKEVTINKK
jgi:hypothetical protein